MFGKHNFRKYKGSHQNSVSKVPEWGIITKKCHNKKNIGIGQPLK